MKELIATIERAKSAQRPFKFELNLSGTGEDCFVLRLKDMQINDPLDLPV